MQQPPAGLWGMPPELLQALTGYDPDVQKNRAEARRVMHDPAYVTLSFDEDVDKCLAVEAQRHCAPQIGVVERRLVAVDNKICG